MGIVRELHDRFRGCLTGWIVGEAAARLAETLPPSRPGQPPERIQTKTMDKLDLTTPSWQVIEAVAECLMRRCDFSESDLRGALQPTGRDDDLLAAVMPLAVFHAARHDQPDWPKLMLQIVQLKLQIQAKDTAAVEALAVASTIVELCQAEKRYETTLAKNCIGPHCRALANASSLERQLQINPAERLTNQIVRLLDLRVLRSGRVLRQSCRDANGRLDVTTVGIGLTITHAERFEAGLTAATEESCPERPQLTALVGAMIGANVGLAGIPAEWLRDLPVVEHVRQLTDRLVSAAWSDAD